MVMLLAAVVDFLRVLSAELAGLTRAAVAAGLHASLHILLPGAGQRLSTVQPGARCGYDGTGRHQEKQQRHHRHLSTRAASGPVYAEGAKA